MKIMLWQHDQPQFHARASLCFSRHGHTSHSAQLCAQLHSYTTDNRKDKMHLFASIATICSSHTEHDTSKRSNNQIWLAVLTMSSAQVKSADGQKCIT